MKPGKGRQGRRRSQPPLKLPESAAQAPLLQVRLAAKVSSCRLYR